MKIAPFIFSNNSNKSVIRNYIIALIPLIIYGFYKNGIVLYQKELINVTQMFKPIFFPFFGLLISFIVSYIYHKLIKKEGKYALFNITILNGMILGMLMQPSVSLIGFCLVLFISNILLKFIEPKISFNNIAFLHLVFIILFTYILNIGYANVYENSVAMSLSLSDMFLGKAIGGINATSILICLLSYIFLCMQSLYKKEIPLFIIISFFSLLLIKSFIAGDLTQSLPIMFSYNIVFAAIFVAPEFLSSTYTRGGKIIYGCVIGLLTFIFILLNLSYLSIFIAILLVSFFTKYIDNLFIKTSY